MGPHPGRPRLPLKVVDASVALKWVYEEESGAETARELLRPGFLLTAPSLWLFECANGLQRRYKAGRLSEAEASALYGYLARIPVALIEGRDLAAEAYALALTLRHPVYDCSYLALALRENAPLVTADMRFADVATRHGFGGSLEVITPDHP